MIARAHVGPAVLVRLLARRRDVLDMNERDAAAIALDPMLGIGPAARRPRRDRPPRARRRRADARSETTRRGALKIRSRDCARRSAGLRRRGARKSAPAERPDRSNLPPRSAAPEGSDRARPRSRRRAGARFRACAPAGSRSSRGRYGRSSRRGHARRAAASCRRRRHGAARRSRHIRSRSHGWLPVAPPRAEISARCRAVWRGACAWRPSVFPSEPAASSSVRSGALRAAHLVVETPAIGYVPRRPSSLTIHPASNTCVSTSSHLSRSKRSSVRTPLSMSIQ